MGVKVFVLGRPGSGKTTVVHHILNLVEREGFIPCRMKDYNILYKMFQADVKHEKFKPAEYGGFNVIDYSVCNLALERLEEEVCALEMDSSDGAVKPNFITIEFARDDYSTAFYKFNKDFLKDSYFFFLESNLDTCIERIHGRVTYPPQPDRHFVSDEIMHNYYHVDNQCYMLSRFCQDYGVPEERVVVYENTGSMDELYSEAVKLVGTILKEYNVRGKRGVREEVGVGV